MANTPEDLSYTKDHEWIRVKGDLATVGITDLVEAMHHTIVRTPGILGEPAKGQTNGITGFVYRSVRGVTRLVGGGVDALLALVAPLIVETRSTDWANSLASSASDLSLPDGITRS